MNRINTSSSGGTCVITFCKPTNNNKNRKNHSDTTKTFYKTDIKMLDFFFIIDNIFVMFSGRVFQQTGGIQMGTNFAPHLVDLFLYLYEADFIQGLLKKSDRVGQGMKQI
jgi:hypothetical protein